MKQKNNSLRYSISFLLPVFLLIIVWKILGLAPFGVNNLLVSDLGTQYLPFLNDFKRFFTEGGESFYSFSNGIGGPMEATIAYYLMSPFNFISLFFSYEMLPIAVLVIITLKIASMSLTMYTYLDKHYHKSTIMTYSFSVAYSLCGFVVVYLLNFMWLDVLILFPLLVLGLEELWKKQRYGLYVSMLFLSIVTNYYLGYMVCIFSVAYSVYLYYLREREEKLTISTFFKEWRLFSLSSLLAGLATSFMLLPAILGMLHTGKSTFYMQDFFPVPRFGLEVFSQMGVGTVNYGIRLDHLPMIYSGLFVWLLAFVYFTLPNVPHKKKKAMAGLLIFIYFSFFFEVFNTVWHMFQSPAGFPYRNSFIFSFILIKLAYETYLYAKQHPDEELVAKKLTLAGVTYTITLSIGQFFLVFQAKESYLLSNLYFVLSLGMIWLFVILFRLKLSNSSKGWQICLTLLMCFELGTNLWISMKDIPFGNQEKYETMYQEQDSIIKHLLSGQESLFRINQKIEATEAGYSEINNGYNNPMLFGYSGVSSYTSTLDATVQDALVELGMYAKNDRRFSYVDESLVANLLLNVQYTINPKELDGKSLLEEKTHTNIYKNEEAIGAGFLARKELEEVSFQHKKVIPNQESVLQALKPLPEKECYFDSLDKIKVKQRDKQLILTGTVNNSGAVYFYLPQAIWDNVIGLNVNEKEVSSDLFIITNQLFDLGSFSKGDNLTLVLDLSKEIDTRGLELVSLNQEKFNQLIAEQRKQAVPLARTKFGRLEGKAKVTSSNNLLYLSIPYDKNWVVKVDGKKVKTKQIVGDFMGIDLEKGEHIITLNYVSQSFLIGAFISATVIIGTGIYLLIRREKSGELVGLINKE